jgi:hypothetical protein
MTGRFAVKENIYQEKRGRICESPRLHLALLIESQLFLKEQVLGDQRGS